MDPDALQLAARAFLAAAYGEAQRADEGARRADAAEAEIRATGTWTPTAEELEWGGRMAWRNSARCIGRLFWPTLEVVDARHVRTPEAFAGALRRHLAEATNGGRLRNRMTVFAPDGPEGPAPLRLANRQLIGYAGFRDGDRVLGDPAHVALTDRALALGWDAAPGPWRVLPWIVETATGDAHLFPVPDELVLEVPIRHPEHPGVAGLGLRWYAVPALADLVLHLGGLDFPAAPFNGWYMVTEIAARDLADAERFDALPAVARAIGRSPEGDPYARDAALLALNEAVWHSFRADGVRIVDHHLASEQYVRFAEQELACGRTPNAEWSWLVPPMSPALAPQFHTPMAHEARDPEFRYRPGSEPPPAQRRARGEPETAGRAATGGTPPPGCPFHARAGEA